MRTTTWLKGISVLGLFVLVLSGCASSKSDDGDNGSNILETCGNGVVDPGEECDDGNMVAHDGCSPECKWEAFCGNGRVEPGEECDDGNLKNDDGCASDCTLEVGCGNGKLEIGEQCDDDNVVSGDGCSSDCVDEDGVATCGNGIVEWGEGCDDGNNEDGDGCSSDCKREDGCGNGTQDPGEQCDDGNNVAGDGCSSDCKLEFICGDHQCDTAHNETCDLCPIDCCPSCGNGVLDKDEECDDGNNFRGDGCSPGCKDEDGVATCGNGIWEQGEECDSALEYEDAKCADDCTWAWVCGDGLCSSDKGETCDLCKHDCCPECGNHVVDTIAEQCDSSDLQGFSCELLGFDGGTLSCTDSCEFDTSACTGTGPVCGNGVIEPGEECDGNNLGGYNCQVMGYENGTLFCDNHCKLNTAGCDTPFLYLREDFDDLNDTHGWTLTGVWGRGTPEGGPATSFTSPFLIATNVRGAAPKDLAYDDDSAAISPVFHVPSDSTPVVVAWAWCDLSDTGDEGWTIEYSIDGGNTWVPATTPEPDQDKTVSGHDYWRNNCTKEWRPFKAYLPGAPGHDTQIRIKAIFEHYSTSYYGVAVDSVVVGDENALPVWISTPSDLGQAYVGYEWEREMKTWGGSGNYSVYVVDQDNTSWIDVDSDNMVLSGTPDSGSIGVGTLTLKVVDSQDSRRIGIRHFIVQVGEALFYEDFEGDASGWTFSGDWEVGTPTSGPGTCPSGNRCVGLKMNANYSNNQDWACVTSPEIDLSSTTSAILSFKGWNETESSYDGVILEVQNNGTWEQVNDVSPAYSQQVDGNNTWAWSGYFQTWMDYSADLSAYTGQTIRLRWCFYSDTSVTKNGFFFDDVVVSR